MGSDTQISQISGRFYLGLCRPVEPLENKDGIDIYGYGGDFNKYDASDNNFNDNGLISPDRRPNPHAHEVGYFYQSIWTTPGDLSKGEIKVYNENFFRDLSAYYMEWQLLANGEVMQTGVFRT